MMKIVILILIVLELMMLAFVVMDTKAIADGDIKINHIGILFKLLIYGSVLVETSIIAIAIIDFRSNNLNINNSIELFIISVITFIVRMVVSIQKEIDSVD